MKKIIVVALFALVVVLAGVPVKIAIRKKQTAN